MSTGLNLGAGQTLSIRDYDGSVTASAIIPITVDQQFCDGAGGTLRMIFEADAWDSTISFAAGIPVTLGGSLELAFAAGVDLDSQIGRTFESSIGLASHRPAHSPSTRPYVWDLTNLYTTGEVTFIRHRLRQPRARLLLSSRARRIVAADASD